MHVRKPALIWIDTWISQSTGEYRIEEFVHSRTAVVDCVAQRPGCCECTIWTAQRMVSSLETQCLTYIAEHGPYIGLGNSLAAGDLFQDLRDMLCPALTTVSSQFWSKWFYNTLNNPTEALIPFTSRTQSQVFDLSAWEGLPLADTLQRLCSSDINQKAMAIGEIASPYLTSLVFDKSTTQHAFAQVQIFVLCAHVS